MSMLIPVLPVHPQSKTKGNLMANSILNEVLDLYVVRSNDGKFLRSKGYGGSGECWVTDINKAKIYSRPGPAKAQCTWWFEHYPVYGRPDVWKITGTVSGKVEHKKPAMTKAEKEHAVVSARLKRSEDIHRNTVAELEAATTSLGPNSMSVRVLKDSIKDFLSEIASYKKKLTALDDTIAKQKAGNRV